MGRRWPTPGCRSRRRERSSRRWRSSPTRLTAADPMPGRVLYDEDLTRFAAGAKPVTDTNASPSPEPPADAFAELAAARGARGRPAAGAALAFGPDPH